MTYSKIHQKFSEVLNKPDVLTDPEKYLGLNYQDVLNFWIYVDTLSEQEKQEMRQCYWDMDTSRNSAFAAAIDAAKEVVGCEFRNSAWNAALDVTGRRVVFGTATCELIAHHKLLEQGKTPIFLPLCVNN